MKTRIASTFLVCLSLMWSTCLPAQFSPPESLNTSALRMTDYNMGGGFWRTDANFEPVLRVKNVLEVSSLSVTPILFMADGTEYDLRPLTLDKAGIASIDIKDALRDAPLQIAAHGSEFGSAALRYTWKWRDAAVAEITNTDVIHSLTYTTHLSASISAANMQESHGEHLSEGLWWNQTPTTIPFLSLVNTSDKTVTAHIVLSDSTDRYSTFEEVNLAAKHSQIVGLGSLLQQLPADSSSGGIGVSYVGSGTALVIEGGLEDFKAGYSAPLPLLSLNARRVRSQVSGSSTTFAAIGVQVGIPDSKLQFPKGTTLTPYLTLRNITDAPLSVKANASFMSPGSLRASLGAIALSPKETKQVDVLTLLRGIGMSSYSGAMTFTYTIDGAADSLLVATGSTSKDANYVFAVDPTIVVPETGRLFCEWQVLGKTNTMFSVWNSGNSAEKAAIVLYFKGGTYQIPLNLGQGESKEINLASLIHSGLPDANGHIIPAGITDGSARLINTAGRRVPMQTMANEGVFNVETATCREPCPTCDGVVAVAITPPSEGVLVGGTQQYIATATDKAGNTWDVTSATRWSTDNSSVAAMSNSAMVTGMSEGTANVNATYSDTGVSSWNDGSLCNYPLPQCPHFIAYPTTPIGVGLKLGITTWGATNTKRQPVQLRCVMSEWKPECELPGFFHRTSTMLALLDRRLRSRY